MSIKENVAAVRRQIEESAKKSGRDPSEIKLIGVTKTVDIPQIKELLLAGVTDLGENKVQEFLPKYEALKNFEPRPTWHFLGHLQRNKVKFIVDKVDLIHSVDSLSLAEEINKRAEHMNRKVKILTEVNISGEINKFGVSPSEVHDFVKNLANMHNLEFSGLMCVAPFAEKPEQNVGLFSKMRNLFVDNCYIFLHNKHRTNFTLSMGMSGDFTAAISSGSNAIRIGTALFGERSYK